jgi:hypothetical protein
MRPFSLSTIGRFVLLHTRKLDRPSVVAERQDAGRIERLHVERAHEAAHPIHRPAPDSRTKNASATVRQNVSSNNPPA